MQKIVIKSCLVLAALMVSAYAVEHNTDRPGGDYKTIENINLAACEAACETETQCKSWTYVKPNTIQGPRSQCYLKSLVPEKVYNQACESGVAKRAELTYEEVRRIVAKHGGSVKFKRKSVILEGEFSKNNLNIVVNSIVKYGNAKLYVSIVRKAGGLAKSRVQALKEKLADVGLQPSQYHVQRVSKKDRKDRAWLSQNDHLWMRVVAIR
jgi:hypothetical protein